VGTKSCVAASGDISDYQQLQHMLDSLTVKQSQLDDGHELRTSQVFEYLTRVMYNRRTKMNPLWNSLLVAGWEESNNGDGAP
jgi:20S proteasome subunit beta 7